MDINESDLLIISSWFTGMEIANIMETQHKTKMKFRAKRIIYYANFDYSISI